jgi:hypothetical protein
VYQSHGSIKALATFVVHHSTQKGWHSLHWSGVIKTSARVGEEKIKFDKKRKDCCSKETLLVCVCVFPSSAIRPHAFTELVFSVVLIT